jgi:hypothetical protein
VIKHNFDQTPILLENFDQLIRSSEIWSSDPLSWKPFKLLNKCTEIKLFLNKNCDMSLFAVPRVLIKPCTMCKTIIEWESKFISSQYNDNETLFWFKAMIVKLCLTMEILLRTINGASWSHNRNAYGEQSKCVRFQIRLPATNNLSAYASLMDSLRNILVVDT